MEWSNTICKLCEGIYHPTTEVRVWGNRDQPTVIIALFYVYHPACQLWMRGACQGTAVQYAITRRVPAVGAHCVAILHRTAPRRTAPRRTAPRRTALHRATPRRATPRRVPAVEEVHPESELPRPPPRSGSRDPQRPCGVAMHPDTQARAMFKTRTTSPYYYVLPGLHLFIMSARLPPFISSVTWRPEQNQT